MPTKPKKTRYCLYFHDCDRPENCFKGRFCPFFKSNPDISPEQLEEDDKTGEDALNGIFDDVWGGKKEVRR